MGRTFKDQIAADFRDILLNGDELAETVTFSPALGGADRLVMMIVSQTQVYEQREQGEELVQVIEITCGRDEAHAKGGIAELSLGDVIHRAGDETNVNYVWAGVLLDGTSDHRLRAQFRRALVTKRGGQQQDKG